MCYQCSGCGRCMGNNQVDGKLRCPCCRRLVPETVTYCPHCGMYILPRAGSRAYLARRAKLDETSTS